MQLEVPEPERQQPLANGEQPLLGELLERHSRLAHGSLIERVLRGDEPEGAERQRAWRREPPRG